MSNRIVPLSRVLLVATLLLFVAACGAASAPILGPVGAGTGGAAPGEAPQPAKPATGSNTDGTGGQVPQYDNLTANLLIIKTGTMDLQVAGLDDALAAASQKVAGLGGYVSGSSRSGDDEYATASVTFRIPSAKWDEALVAMRGLGIKVLGEQSQTEDVTSQVVDLSARITNLQSTEQAFQAIMARTTKISEVLEVQAKLTEVRGQIEQATAERKHLQESAAFSTLTVNLSLKAVAIEVTKNQFDPASEVDQASASLVGILQGLATAGIWFGIVWLPILLALGLIAAIVIWVLRRMAPVRAGDSPSGPAEPPMAAPPATA